MSYYSSYNNTSWWEIIILFALCLLLIFGCDACTAHDWNDGICPECHTRYELRGASRGLKYYACPKCGNEVSRFLS